MRRVRTRTHDDKRHGTITLFAALNYLDGKLIVRIEACHTQVEWLRFLKHIDPETPKEVELHLIITVHWVRRPLPRSCPQSVPAVLERVGAKALFAADSRYSRPYSHYNGTIPTDL